MINVMNKMGARKIACFMLALFIVLTPLSFSVATDTFSLSVAEAQTTGGGGQAGAEELATQSYGCGWDCELGSKIGSWILSIGGLFSGFGGLLLQYSLENFVIKMSSTLNDGQMGKLIEDLWKVIRDLANLVFIFGFIYIGIRTIFDPQSSQVKSFLAQLVIAALLINFSLFFVRVVIDVTNLFALEVSKLMSVDGETNIAYAFAKEMGLPGLFGEIDSDRLAALTTGGSITFFIGGTLFLLIAGFVFMAAAVLLVVRFVALVFIMIFSPFLIIGSVVGQLQSKLSWKLLFNYAIFAPAFLFLLFISYKIMQASPWSETNGAQSLAKAMTSSAESVDTFTIILQFTVGIIFIIASLQLAQKIGIAGGNTALSVGKRLRGYGQGFIGRNSVGWIADKAGRAYDRADDRDGRMARGIRKLGLDRSIVAVTEAGKNAKFGSDISRAGIQKFDKERATKRSQVRPVFDLQDALEQKDSESVAKLVAGMSKGQLEEAGMKTLEQDIVLENLSHTQMEQILGSDKFNNTQKSNLSKARGEAIERILLASADNNAKLVNVIGKASISQLESLGADRLIENADGLTTSQIEDLKKSKKFTEVETQQISKTRDGRLTYKVELGQADQVFKGMKDKDIAKLPKEALTHSNAAPYINAGVLKAIQNEHTLSSEDRAKIEKNVRGNDEAPASAKNYLDSPRGQDFA